MAFWCIWNGWGRGSSFAWKMAGERGRGGRLRRIFLANACIEGADDDGYPLKIML